VSQISLEETVEQSKAEHSAAAHHAAERESLRKQFLKQARKHYSKELWKDGYFKVLAGTGMVFAGGGLIAYAATDSMWAILPLGAGVMNTIQAAVKHRSQLNKVIDTFDKKTRSLTSDDLEQRLDKKDFSFPDPTPEDNQHLEMDMYALAVVQEVAQKDFKFTKYPWPTVGVGILAYGTYSCFTDNPVAGGMTMTMGGVVMLASHYMKKRKLVKLMERTSKYLREKGYDYFDSYIRKKEPYFFYERFILEKKPVAD
jgi:hypothetical protein